MILPDISTEPLPEISFVIVPSVSSKVPSLETELEMVSAEVTREPVLSISTELAISAELTTAPEIVVVPVPVISWVI